MKSIILNLDDSSDRSLYIQIYGKIKSDILSGAIEQGVKLPSLRRFAEENGISVTTVEAAYNQLLVEGYIESRPKSGYYVADSIAEAVGDAEITVDTEGIGKFLPDEAEFHGRENSLLYDEESFEFSKWKKSMNRVFNEYSHLLRTEADAQGEAALRYEIAKYLFTGRGVKCTPEQIVIGAGSQQLTAHLVRILREIGIDHAATEAPGYGPIRDVFKDEGFSLSEIPVGEGGIRIEKLPMNMRSIVYVNPSNQFPSGEVMPIGRRYELLRWAAKNDSYIFEDDYDSELRYFGKPIPALQGLDSGGKVIYLGSFSATLFSAIKISYMVLPEELVRVFERIKERYSQTCSKTEQLCLALYMEDGYYYRNIKKCRRLYASKLETTMHMFEKNSSDIIEAVDSKSGMSVMLRIKTHLPVERLCGIGQDLGLMMRPVEDLCTEEMKVITFYFYRVSNSLLTLLIKMYVQNMKKAMADS